MQTEIGKKVIVRTEKAGVHFGTVAEKNGNEVRLENTRRIWYWDGAASLSELATEGPSKPENCRFPPPSPSVTLQWIEILLCTDRAAESIEQVKPWTRHDK